MQEELITGKFMGPLPGLLPIFFGDFRDDMGIEHMAVGAVTDVMEKACKGYGQNR